MSRLFARFLIDDGGQDLIEYALLAGFISLTATTLIGAVGVRVNEWYESYGVTISSIPSGSGS